MRAITRGLPMSCDSALFGQLAVPGQQRYFSL
jgi:hypothetical protein